MMAKSTLLSQLQDRRSLLENRRFMLPRYVDDNRSWSGKNHYSLDMLPAIDLEIAETEAAIKGIEEWKKEKSTVVEKKEAQ